MNNISNLTLREQEIFDLLLKGTSQKEMAYKLDISYSTVGYHRKNIYRKLNVQSIHELFAGFYSENVNSDSKIIFADNKNFTERTFETIYLHSSRNRENNNRNYSEQYTSHENIYLKDIYDGSFDELINATKDHEGAFWSSLLISGTIDKKLTRIGINFCHKNEKTRGITHLGGEMCTRFSEIGPGDFKETVYFTKFDPPVDLSKLPKGEAMVYIVQRMIWTDPDLPDNWSFENIPADIPDGTVMATIRNFKIEPIAKKPT